MGEARKTNLCDNIGESLLISACYNPKSEVTEDRRY